MLKNLNNINLLENVNVTYVEQKDIMLKNVRMRTLKLEILNMYQELELSNEIDIARVESNDSELIVMYIVFLEETQ